MQTQRQTEGIAITVDGRAEANVRQPYKKGQLAVGS